MLQTRLAPAVILALSALIAKNSSAYAQSSPANDTGSSVTILVIYLLIGAAIAYFMWRNRRPFSVQHRTAVASDYIVNQAIQTYTMQGWAVTSQTPMNLTVERRLQGSCLIALLLLLLGIFPGIFYLASRNKRMVSSVHVTPGATGSGVSIMGNVRGFGGEAAAKKVVRELG